MNEEEKKQIKDFEYWVNTNNEKGVCSIPDYICNRVLNVIDKQQKEIKNLAQKTNELIDEYEEEILEKNNYIFRLENETESLHKLIDEEMG